MSKLFTLVGTNGQPYQSQTPGTLGGYKPDKIYGRLDCPSALRFLAKGQYAQHRVFFVDEVTAIAAGYRPCSRCMPEAYKQWKLTREITFLIRQAKYHFSSEADLQTGIATLLTDAGLAHKREVVLTPKDRIDFLVGDIGIEVKIDGSLASVTRQLWRYAERPEIKSLILVTTRYFHTGQPEQMNGKPLHVVHLLNSIL